jgi:hypothetical protein
MRYIQITSILFLFILLWFCLASCEKRDTQLVHPITLTLYDKPLCVIQSCITGNWKLQYGYGGLITHKYIDTLNSYMILCPNHIILGNDTQGVVVDTNIVWVRSDIGSNDFTYLLSFTWSGYPWPWYYIVSEIKNDTLIIRDDIDDGYSYYYFKY